MYLVCIYLNIFPIYLNLSTCMVAWCWGVLAQCHAIHSAVIDQAPPKPPPKNKAIVKRKFSSNSNMNARVLGWTSLEYLDSLDLKFEKKAQMVMVANFGGIGNISAVTFSSSAAWYIGTVNRECNVTCRGNPLQHAAVAYGLLLPLKSRGTPD
jgi:hypothetical protein